MKRIKYCGEYRTCGHKKNGLPLSPIYQSITQVYTEQNNWCIDLFLAIDLFSLTLSGLKCMAIIPRASHFRSFPKKPGIILVGRYC